MVELGWKSVGLLGPSDRCPASERRRPLVSVLLDAAVRAGGSPTVTADGLGGSKRREHGDDPSDRRGLRRLAAAHWWR